MCGGWWEERAWPRRVRRDPYSGEGRMVSELTGICREWGPLQQNLLWEQSCSTALSYLTLESTRTAIPAVLPLGFPSKQTMEHDRNAPTTNSVWMGLPAHLFLWGPDLTQKVFIYCCQKHLGWYKNVLEDTTKWSSSLNKGHFTLEYLKNIVCYVKKSSGLAKGKFLTGYVSWKGPLKTTEQGLFYSNTLKMESGCRLHALQSLAVLTSRDKDFRFKRKMHFWKTLCYKKENFKCFHCCWSSSEEDTSKSQASWETTWGSCRTHWTHFLSVLKQEYQWTGSLFLNHLIARSWLGKNKKWEAAV